MTEDDTFNKLRKPTFDAMYNNYIGWLNNEFSFNGLTLTLWLDKNNWDYVEFANACIKQAEDH